VNTSYIFGAGLSAALSERIKTTREKNFRIFFKNVKNQKEKSFMYVNSRRITFSIFVKMTGKTIDNFVP
jgi:hypothetical protein